VVHRSGAASVRHRFLRDPSRIERICAGVRFEAAKTRTRATLEKL
jgi:hypothetical protein